MTDFCGYVLAGGRSSRMGSDKALLSVNDRTAIERQCELLEPLCPQGVFIAGARSKELQGLRWPVIEDAQHDQGPLSGIVGAMQHAQLHTRDLQVIALVLAVDLLAIETVDIAAVIAACSQDVDHQFDVFFAQNQQDPSDYGAQPLCAAWRVESSHQVLTQQLEQGQRSVMKAWLGLKRQGVLISESHLINVNTPSEFENFSRAKG